jgi:hypothetical protein
MLAESQRDWNPMTPLFKKRSPWNERRPQCLKKQNKRCGLVNPMPGTHVLLLRRRNLMLKVREHSLMIKLKTTDKCS